MTKSKGKSAGVERLEQNFHETPLEAQSRKEGSFSNVEEKLPKRFTRSEMNLIDKGTSLLGTHNPFGKKADPQKHEVWVLNNTAYRPLKPGNDVSPPWEAEFVACFFQSGRKDITKTVSTIADLIGLDGQAGNDPEARKRIQERLRPFVQAIAPARTVEISIPSSGVSGNPHKRTLGPSNQNGISSQILPTGGPDDLDGKSIIGSSLGNLFTGLSFTTRFAGPEGWAVISDIDDTIKITQTSSPIGILKSTFADVPQTTSGMPEFYQVLEEHLGSPAWFYLSASPYNLYLFLAKFISENYPAGTVILRDASWMYLGGLLQSFTEGVQEYKTDRLAKIHSWLPSRKIICIGDSTQSDPEAYAEMYARHPEWIKAIYIRKVTDIPHMDTKNKNQRFIDAFKNVPDHVWRVFSKPQELAEHVKHLTGEAHSGMVGSLMGL